MHLRLQTIIHGILTNFWKSSKCTPSTPRFSFQRLFYEWYVSYMTWMGTSIRTFVTAVWLASVVPKWFPFRVVLFLRNKKKSAETRWGLSEDWCNCVKLNFVRNYWTREEVWLRSLSWYNQGSCCERYRAQWFSEYWKILISSELLFDDRYVNDHEHVRHFYLFCWLTTSNTSRETSRTSRDV